MRQELDQHRLRRDEHRMTTAESLSASLRYIMKLVPRVNERDVIAGVDEDRCHSAFAWRAVGIVIEILR